MDRKIPSILKSSTGVLTYQARITTDESQDGTAVNPTDSTASYQIYKPDGVQLVDSTATSDGSGAFTITLTPTQTTMTGTYSLAIKWVYAGKTHNDVEPFLVKSVQGYSYGLVTLDEFKDFIQDDSTGNDARYAEMISALAQVVKTRYGREFVPYPSVDGTANRTFKVRDRLISLSPYDLRTANTVTLHPEDSTPTTLTANTDYVLLPIGGSEGLNTYTELKIADDVSLSSTFSGKFGFAQIQIKGTWGAWSDSESVPLDIKRAALETLSSWTDKAVSEWGGGVELLGDARQIAPTVSTWDIPFAAHLKFQAYSRSLGVY